jgi:hypothetical protein
MILASNPYSHFIPYSIMITVIKMKVIRGEAEYSCMWGIRASRPSTAPGTLDGTYGCREYSSP